MNETKSKKICSIDSCTNPVYMRGWCRFHYTTEHLVKKQAEKPPIKHKIARRTKKRLAQEKKYLQRRKAFIEAERALHPQRKIFCIFCDGEIKGEPDLHHGLGRDDEMLLDEAFWFTAHWSCHVPEYHSKSCKKIFWWKGYMQRIKKINPIIYEKELLRESKS